MDSKLQFQLYLIIFVIITNIIKFVIIYKYLQVLVNL